MFCLGQNMKYIDSLLDVVKSKPADSTIADAYNEIAFTYRKQDNEKALKYSKLALEFAKKSQKPKKEWSALNNLGIALSLIGNLGEATKMHQQALSLATKYDYYKSQGHSLNNLASINQRSDNFQRSKEYYFKALAAYKKANFEHGFYTINNNIGNLYYMLEMPDSAIYHYRKGYEIAVKENNQASIAQIYNNTGMVYWYMGKKDSSVFYTKKAFELIKKFGTKSEIANTGINLGSSYNKMGDYTSGKKILKEMIVYAREANDYNEMGDGYSYYGKALFFTGDYKNAYLYRDSAQRYYDSILNRDKVKALSEATEKYEGEKKQLMINQLNTENSAKETLLVQGRKTKFYMALGLGCVILFCIYLFYTIKQRDKTNRIINEQKKEVEYQKSLIETHQKETLDSINYAKRIQYSLLAHETLLNENLTEYFVLFKPKDIVSGDFYWATSAGDKFYLAVCDSTGHGVPGAFMSLININFMNEAINEKKITKPNEVFNHVRQSLIQNVSQDGQKDGMDGILVCFDKKKINYASANNAPLVISHNQIVEFPKDKMPVGAGEKEASFNLHELNVKKGDVVYLYTDGFADQFGGEKGKKFKYKQLNELLLSISQLPLVQQKQKLQFAFENWKGNLEQVDDVCVVGIRI